MTELEFQQQFERAYDKKHGGLSGLLLLFLIFFFGFPALAMTALPFWGAMACRGGWVSHERFCANMTSNPLVEWSKTTRK